MNLGNTHGETSRDFSRVKIAARGAPIVIVLFILAVSGFSWSQSCLSEVAFTEVNPAHSLAAIDGWAYLGTSAGFNIFDVSVPASPVGAGFVGAGGNPYALAATEDHLFVCAHSAGFLVYDLSSPDVPSQIGSLPNFGNCFDIAVDNGLAFLAYGNDGLEVIDISLPASPQHNGSCDTSEYALGVAVENGHAFVASRDSGLRIIDISDPSDPLEVGYYTTDVPFAVDIAVSNNVGYLASDSGLTLLDVSVPSSPSLILTKPSYSRNVRLFSRYMLADGSFSTGSGLTLFDLSDPRNPTYIDVIAEVVNEIVIDGNYAFLAKTESSPWDTEGLKVLYMECVPFFSDGFESGNTTLWSSTAP